MYKDQQITDIFTPDQLKNSIVLDAYDMETSIFLNDGTGRFTRKALPVETQFSSVYAAEVGDYNSDGNLDILLGGNMFNVKPEVGRYDASYGTFLIGNGHGDFKYIAPKFSGFRLNGEIRDIMEVKTSNGKILVIAGSNQPVQVFKEISR